MDVAMRTLWRRSAWARDGASVVDVGRFPFQARRLAAEEPVINDRVKECLLQELGLNGGDELQRRINRLVCLIPDLRLRLGRMQPKLVAQLLEDERRTGKRLLALKLMLPNTNVSSVAARCPNLLLSPVWERVEQRRRELQQILPTDASVESVVQEVPLVLMIDIRQVAADLRRLIPGCEPGEVLASNPAIILNTMNISHLSMW